MANPAEIRRNAASTKLDRLVTWRERDNVRSSRGRNVKTFTDREIWAKRLTKDGIYNLESGGLIRVNADIRWLVRFDDRMKVTDRIVDEGVSYPVTAVSELDRRRWLELSTGSQSP